MKSKLLCGLISHSDNGIKEQNEQNMIRQQGVLYMNHAAGFPHTLQSLFKLNIFKLCTYVLSLPPNFDSGEHLPFSQNVQIYMRSACASDLLPNNENN